MVSLTGEDQIKPALFSHGHFALRVGKWVEKTKEKQRSRKQRSLQLDMPGVSHCQYHVEREIVLSVTMLDS